MGWFFNNNTDNNPDTFSNRSENNDQSSSYSYSRSYSSSKKCYMDPEDDAFMICDEEIWDGNNKITNRERIPKGQSNNSIAPSANLFAVMPSFFDFFSDRIRIEEQEFKNFFFPEMKRETFQNPQNSDFFFTPSNNPQGSYSGYSRPPRTENSKNYFTSNYKDTNIRDL